VPESLLTEKSESFKAACRNEWKEAISRVVKLSEIDADTFHSYLFWVYRDKIVIRDGSSVKADTQGMEHVVVYITGLVKLWILADRVADVRLRNAVIDELTFKLEERTEIEDRISLFPPALTTHVWSSTTANRPLRRVALDYYVGLVTAAQVKTQRDDFEPEFLKDIMVAAMEKIEDDDKEHYPPHKLVEREGQCYYHEHDEQCPPCSEKQGEEIDCS
jgi:hypothetical protein